jgi:aspartate kinase
MSLPPLPEPTRSRPIVVQKFGGSSVADIEKIGRVADRVVATKRAGHDVVVVVSAMGKTTDELLGLARRAATYEGRAIDPPRRELDMLLTTGERVTMSLVSIAIQSRGEEAISFTGSQSGILTNDRHFDARIIEVRPHRIEDELARGRIVIVAGYQGMSYRREITTLGRGGSDTTAVALAAALRADRCEIYSDVDGVYSADPRAVPSATHLPELEHAMLQEMAECGAKVVCAQAVEWARRAGIAIHARATFGDGSRETVSRDTSRTSSARAVVACRQVAHGHLSGPLGERELTRALSVLDDEGIPLGDVTASEEALSFDVPLLNVPDFATRRERVLRELSGLVLSPPMGLVSVVGDGLGTGRAVQTFRATLEAAGTPVLGLRAHALRLTARVPEAALEVAQRALHAAFVEQP